MPELKLYSVADIRKWLVNNKPVEGLNEQVIAPTRAWAIIHNPYVKDDDAIVAAIFEDGLLAAYTASFPDMLDGKRIWWCSTLYCYPQFAGRSYGVISVGSLMEAHEPDLTYDRWGAAETTEIFRCLGSQTAYTDRYFIGDGNIDKDTFRGKIAYLKQKLNIWRHSRLLRLAEVPYTLRYISYIDDVTYDFIRQHQHNDLIVREQRMLNWILRYSFTQSCPLIEHVSNDTIFTAFIRKVHSYAVQVWRDDVLVGFYTMKHNNHALHITYLYYQSSNQVNVFASIRDHIVKLKIRDVETENEDLANYLRRQIYFPKFHVEKVSFSYPQSMELPSNYSMQYGDGDSFA